VLVPTAVYIHVFQYVFWEFLKFYFFPEESALVETSPTEQSNHGVPEIAIGIILASLKFHEVLILIRLSLRFNFVFRYLLSKAQL